MRWGRFGVALLVVVVGLNAWLLGQPWDGPTRVDALELDDDEARRQEDASDLEVRDDDGDDDGPAGTRSPTPGGAEPAEVTDDGRDGTHEGDTRGGRGTGTANDQDGGGTDLTAASATFDIGGGGGTTAGDADT